jgi:hypothetical protein
VGRTSVDRECGNLSFVHINPMSQSCCMNRHAGTSISRLSCKSTTTSGDRVRSCCVALFRFSLVVLALVIAKRRTSAHLYHLVNLDLIHKVLCSMQFEILARCSTTRARVSRMTLARSYWLSCRSWREMLMYCRWGDNASHIYARCYASRYQGPYTPASRSMRDLPDPEQHLPPLSAYMTTFLATNLLLRLK